MHEIERLVVFFSIFFIWSCAVSWINSVLTLYYAKYNKICGNYLKKRDFLQEMSGILDTRIPTYCISAFWIKKCKITILLNLKNKFLKKEELIGKHAVVFTYANPFWCQTHLIWGCVEIGVELGLWEYKMHAEIIVFFKFISQWWFVLCQCDLGIICVLSVWPGYNLCCVSVTWV